MFPVRTFGTRDLILYQPKRTVYLNNQLRLGVDLDAGFIRIWRSTGG